MPCTKNHRMCYINVDVIFQDRILTMCIKNTGPGPARWLSEYKGLVLFKRTCVLFSAPICCLTTIYNSNSR